MKKMILCGAFVVFAASLGMEKKITRKIIDVSTVTCKNRREYQEDTIALFNKDNFSIFAVFDGHNGKNVSSYLQDNFCNILYDKIKNKSCTITLLTEAFETAEANLRLLFEQETISQSGSTVSVVCFDKNKLVVGNVGDSRLIVGNVDGTVSFATEDHKPKAELGKRLKEDQVLCWDSVWRLKLSTLSVSRALGDIDLKKYDSALIAAPDCNEILLNENHNCIILGSDGLYDVMSNEEIVKITNDGIKNNKSAQEIAKILLYKAIEKNSTDNTSIIVIRLGTSEKQFDFKNLQVVSYDGDEETKLLIQKAKQPKNSTNNFFL